MNDEFDEFDEFIIRIKFKSEIRNIYIKKDELTVQNLLNYGECDFRNKNQLVVLLMTVQKNIICSKKIF